MGKPGRTKYLNQNEGSAEGTNRHTYFYIRVMIELLCILTFFHDACRVVSSHLGNNVWTHIRKLHPIQNFLCLHLEKETNRSILYLVKIDKEIIF